MAASARMSGTTLPASSSLKRGSMASRSAAAWTAALPRTERARRRAAAALDAAAPDTAGFFSVSFVGADELSVDCRTAAFAIAGTPRAVTATTQQISRIVAQNRFRITGNPLGDTLLRNVSAF
jgi:hypothetical protein